MWKRTMKENNNSPRPSLFLAIVPLALTLIVLGTQIFYFDDFTPHIPLAIGLGITAFIGWTQGYRWNDMQVGAFHVVHVALPSLAIIVIIGMLIGTWLASGTVPLLIYYGLQVINPSYFLAACLILCSVVSLSLGTSWTTTGTVGLALVGIGSAFEIPMYWTAGAVISGAFFGDKISPLSDTTNLAPAVTETNLFDHIKNMFPTTVPAMVISFFIYLIAGFNIETSQGVNLDKVNAFIQGIDTSFELNPLLLLPVVVVIILALKKMPAIPSLFVGVLMAGVIAMVTQGASLHDVFTYAHSGFKMDTGVADLDKLLNRGGIESMTWVLTLVMIALCFGGALERTRCLEVIVDSIMSKVKSFRGLQTTAILSSITTNVVSGDVYLSIVLPGRMYGPAYDKLGYSRLNLARAIEEGGTLVSPLVPWNAGGAFVIAALGLGIVEGNIENLLYIPLAFACWLSPVIGIIYAQLGLFSPKAENNSQDQYMHPVTTKTVP